MYNSKMIGRPTYNPTALLKRILNKNRNRHDARGDLTLDEKPRHKKTLSSPSQIVQLKPPSMKEFEE